MIQIYKQIKILSDRKKLLTKEPVKLHVKLRFPTLFIKCHVININVMQTSL